jgi:uncharacterized repeat protein (TIGR03803 family)
LSAQQSMEGPWLAAPLFTTLWLWHGLQNNSGRRAHDSSQLLFRAGCTDGLQPSTSLVEGPGGLLYGTTSFGGATSACQFSQFSVGCGTIFTIAPEGTFATLYSFCAQGVSCPDGMLPASPLVLAPSGDFYGTAQWDGDDSICVESDGLAPGCGTVFKISPSGTLTTLHAFCSQKGCPDGAQPLG